MSCKKKESKYSNNKKAVRSSVEKAAAVFKALMREHQIETPSMHPGQLNFDADLFPTFNYEVKSCQ